jgi:hypothetical protein
MIAFRMNCAVVKYVRSIGYAQESLHIASKVFGPIRLTFFSSSLDLKRADS